MSNKFNQKSKNLKAWKGFVILDSYRKTNDTQGEKGQKQTKTQDRSSPLKTTLPDEKDEKERKDKKKRAPANKEDKKDLN